jgi:hypothetical protein
LLASRLTILIIKIPPDHVIEWHGLGGAIAANETSRSSLSLAFVALLMLIVEYRER